MNLESLAVIPEVRTAALPYRSWVEVSRAQIARNFLAIKEAVGPGVEVMPVVKADAYRHGAVEVSRKLELNGARWLAVSNTEEGVALREAGIQTRILVMADFLPFTREALLAHNLTPVVHSLTALNELNALGYARNERLRCHLKIDSGMGRLGVRAPAPRNRQCHPGGAQCGSGRTDDPLRLRRQLPERANRRTDRAL